MAGRQPKQFQPFRQHDGETGAEQLAAIQREAETRGIVRPARARKTAEVARTRKLTKGIPLRRYESAEGLLILVGRNNEQNDKLSTAVARGNDLWFHIGQGHAGSHVVVRLPKNKSASLETLLDAACLAVHFSKARGAELIEVVYTEAKNVRKPKGLAPGKVLTSRTRSLRVRAEPERLRRVLDTAPAEP